jgi:hypothetical protein
MWDVVIRLAVGVSLAALPMQGGTPLAADEGVQWSSASGEDYCSLRYGTADGEVFAISYRKDTSYALDGTAFANADGTGTVAGEVRVLADGGQVLLNGDAEALDAQAEITGEHPVPLFLAATSVGDSFTVATRAGLEVIPLDGFAGPAADFGKCSRALFLELGPRPPVVLGFDGADRLIAAAERERLISDVVGFALKVDADGKAVECGLSRGFRRAEETLCGPLMSYHRFDPARDKDGKPIPGIYLSQIDFRVMTGSKDGPASEGW